MKLFFNINRFKIDYDLYKKSTRLLKAKKNFYIRKKI